MWDDRSFSQQSFDSRSWLMGVVEAGKRLYVALASSIHKTVTLASRIW